MKRFASLLAIIMAFSFAFNAPVAEAKRFGGGKSFGKSFRTAPAPKKSDATSLNSTKQQSNATKSSSRKGMLGGMLGGLLAGGLIASLLGGAFNGVQMMDFLILGLLAFILFKVFRSMNRAKAMAAGHGSSDNRFSNQFGGNQQQAPQSLGELFGQKKESSHAFDQPSSQAPSSQAQSFQTTGEPSGFAASDVPMNLPDGFNLNAFMNGARDHYRTLQEAWNKNDLQKMQEYLSPELFGHMEEARQTLSGDQHTEVMFVDAELGRADYNASVAQISVRFTGKYRDTVENVEEDITDVWHLERDLTQPNAPWLIVGIEA